MIHEELTYFKPNFRELSRQMSTPSFGAQSNFELQKSSSVKSMTSSSQTSSPSPSIGPQRTPVSGGLSNGPLKTNVVGESDLKPQAITGPKIVQYKVQGDPKALVTIVQSGPKTPVAQSGPKTPVSTIKSDKAPDVAISSETNPQIVSQAQTYQPHTRNAKIKYINMLLYNTDNLNNF